MAHLRVFICLMVSTVWLTGCPTDPDEEFDDDDVPVAQPNGGVPQMTRPNGSIAPAARGAGGAPGGNGAASSNKVTLSKEERGMARQLGASGALNKPNGQRPTDAEAERMYAIQKVRTAPAS